MNTLIELRVRNLLAEREFNAMETRREIAAGYEWPSVRALNDRELNREIETLLGEAQRDEEIQQEVKSMMAQHEFAVEVTELPKTSKYTIFGVPCNRHAYEVYEDFKAYAQSRNAKEKGD